MPGDFSAPYPVGNENVPPRYGADVPTVHEPISVRPFRLRKLRRKKPVWHYAWVGDIWLVKFKGFPPIAFFVTSRGGVKFFSRPISDSASEEISFGDPEIISARQIYPS